jgi:vesicle transport through interaction with t-SNAREs 1
MDLEARTLQPNVKAMVLAKLREYKNDLSNLKAEIKRLSTADSQAARDALLESGMADALMVSVLSSPPSFPFYLYDKQL